jgi:hypothetical protein
MNYNQRATQVEKFAVAKVGRKGERSYRTKMERLVVDFFVFSAPTEFMSCEDSLGNHLNASP